MDIPEDRHVHIVRHSFKADIIFQFLFNYSMSTKFMEPRKHGQNYQCL